ncbi:helix-turn-helix domain-containing protein [Sinomicrobium sp. M5D2P17]
MACNLNGRFNKTWTMVVANDIVNALPKTVFKTVCDFEVNHFENCPLHQIVPFKNSSDQHFAIVLFFKTDGHSNSPDDASDGLGHLLYKSPGEPNKVKNFRGVTNGLFIRFTEKFLLNNRQLLSIMTSFPFLEISLLRNKPLEISAHQAETIKELFWIIFDEYHYNSDKGDLVIVNVYLQAFFLSIKRIYDSQTSGPDSENSLEKNEPKEIIRKFKSLLWLHSINNNNRVFERKTVAEYADLLFIHPNHLYAVVKKETGKTAREYIDDQIFKLAKTLLLQEDLLIKEIAWQLSFSETAHFSNFFRRRAGMAPVAYRKQCLCTTS